MPGVPRAREPIRVPAQGGGPTARRKALGALLNAFPCDSDRRVPKIRGAVSRAKPPGCPHRSRAFQLCHTAPGPVSLDVCTASSGALVHGSPCITKFWVETVFAGAFIVTLPPSSRLVYSSVSSTAACSSRALTPPPHARAPEKTSPCAESETWGANLASGLAVQGEQITDGGDCAKSPSGGGTRDNSPST